MDPVHLELISAIHQGVLGETPWLDFVSKLRKALSANSANIALREAGAALDEVFVVEDYGAPPLPRLKERYLEGFYRDDPFPYFKMPAGSVYRLPALLGVAAPETSPFFTAYLRPAGIEHLLMFHAAEPGGCRAWVTVTRGPGAQDFSQEDADLCQELARQFGTALAVFAAMQEERMRRQLYEHAALQLNVDFLLLDGQGRLLLKAEQAARVKSAGLCLGLGGKLHAVAPEADAAFQLAIALASEGESGQVLHIRDCPYLDVFVSPIALVQPPHPALGRETPAIVIYLHTGPIEIFSSHLEKLFGLSRSEARLAAALARGRTLSEAANDIGLTEQTARRYSKLIFAKTGANRQSELVRRILGSGAILGR